MPQMPKRDANGKFLPADPTNSKGRKRKKKDATATPAGVVKAAKAIKAKATKTPDAKMSAQSIVAAVVGPKTILPPVPVNHIAFIIDRSGSMQGIWSTVIEVLKKNFNEVRGQSIKTGQKTTVTFTGFGDNVEISTVGKAIEDFVLPANLYANLGMTALYDAVGLTIERMVKFSDADESNVSFMFVVLTDGGENASNKYIASTLAKLQQKLQHTDRWSFAYLVPPGNEHIITAMGIPEGNVMAWEASKKGAETAGQSVTRGISNYYTARSSGQRSTKGFFVTDMSKVTSKDLGKLDDISGQVRILSVEKETSIRPFVEEKMGTYRLGSAFYALTKTEAVQPQKSILVMKKGEKTIYGGYQARKLLGLPDGVEIKVKPGNHGNFDIYVQSQSVNRILVRGTKLLVMR